MLTFVVRRIIASFFILLGATFIAYVLVAYSGDPLEAARGIPNPVQRVQTIQTITTTLDLNTTPVLRYFVWLKGIGGCVVGNCNFGTTINQTPVNAELSLALASSLKLITASTVIAIFLGITFGVVSALRQYSGLDYSLTLMAFLFFSLPVIWIGFILKDLLAIQFNDFLQHGANISWGVIIGVSVVVAIVSYAMFGGDLSRRLLTGLITGLVIFGLLYWITVAHWLLHPSLGVVGVAVIGGALGLGSTLLVSGLANKRSLYTSMTTVAVGVALWYPLQFFFHNGMTIGRVFLLLIVALLVGVGIGYLYGGDDKGLSARNGAITAFLVGFVIFVDRLFTAWPAYVSNPLIFGRPIKTQLPATPNLQGDFWIQTTDTLTHLILPTITLMLISLATHSRYARASMLEVMNQDYIRTARSKGLTERTVVMRHALRNALIPMATVVAFDIAGLIGGAVLTESVFGWKSMGALFQTGLTAHDPNPVMAFFLVSAIIAVLVNMLADIAYAALDPRIRLT